MTKFARIAAATAAILLSSAAMATPITLNGSIANNTLLNNNTYTGSFNGTSVLPADYKINSLAFSFTFLDNNDEMTYGKKIVGDTDYVITSYNGHAFEKDVTTSYAATNTGKKENVALTLGGVNYGTKETAASTKTDTKVVEGARTDEGHGCHYVFFCGKLYYTAFTSTTTTTNDWTGAISFSGLITNQSIISQILQNDLLNFSFKVGGDLMLTSSQLVMDITETPKAPVAEVPEPSTIFLALAGLAGLAVSRRKGKRA